MHSLLLEIGVEELPPKSLEKMAAALGRQLLAELQSAHFDLGKSRSRCFATPRRLAVLLDAVQSGGATTRITQGPKLAVAFDPQGTAQPAATGFARKQGVQTELQQAALPSIDPRRLQSLNPPLQPGETRLCICADRLAALSMDLLPPALERVGPAAQRALAELPTGRRMRWGAGTLEFVRPVHWAVLLLDKKVVPCTLLGQRAGRNSYGHRFLSPGKVPLREAADYLPALRRARVIADFAERRRKIRRLVENCAKRCGGQAQIEAALLDEVTALVEWPSAVAGRFAEEYLQLPQAVLIATLQKHQRCFPVRDAAGALLPCFISIANIRSRSPAEIVRGNERVIRPRLADAAFFYTQDRNRGLQSFCSGLREVVFHEKLGSLHDKCERMEQLCDLLAEITGEDRELARQAAQLGRADLLSSMVEEFDDLQGVMGEVYARDAGFPQPLALALREQYLPRFSGDVLPQSALGRILAIAERVDTLTGLFGIGQPPSGSRDPFGLRRAALGLVRILLETGWDLDLRILLRRACAGYTDCATELLPDTEEQVLKHILERFSHWCGEAHDLAPGVRRAVFLRHPSCIKDIWERLLAVRDFSRMPEAEALTAAHKRVANLLQKQKAAERVTKIDPTLVQEPAEKNLVDALQKARQKLQPLLEGGEYGQALQKLATLETPVDQFFDQVLVMAKDPAIRSNRVAILQEMNDIFNKVAYISEIDSSA